MELKWRFFAGAGILAGYFLISNGAPVVPVVVGVALAAGLTFFKNFKKKPRVS